MGDRTFKGKSLFSPKKFIFPFSISKCSVSLLKKLEESENSPSHYVTGGKPHWQWASVSRKCQRGIKNMYLECTVYIHTYYCSIVYVLEKSETNCMSIDRGSVKCGIFIQGPWKSMMSVYICWFRKFLAYHGVNKSSIIVDVMDIFCLLLPSTLHLSPPRSVPWTVGLFRLLSMCFHAF